MSSDDMMELQCRQRINVDRMDLHEGKVKAISKRILAGEGETRDYRGLSHHADKYCLFAEDFDRTARAIEELEMLLAPPLSTEKGERSVAV